MEAVVEEEVASMEVVEVAVADSMVDVAAVVEEIVEAAEVALAAVVVGEEAAEEVVADPRLKLPSMLSSRIATRASSSHVARRKTSSLPSI